MKLRPSGYSNDVEKALEAHGLKLGDIAWTIMTVGPQTVGLTTGSLVRHPQDDPFVHIVSRVSVDGELFVPMGKRNAGLIPVGEIVNVFDFSKNASAHK